MSVTSNAEDKNILTPLKASGVPAPRRIVTTKASEVVIERPRWAWDQFFPLRTVTGLGGRGGEGKSTFTLYAAAMASKGTLPGEFYGTPRRVLIQATEDSQSMMAARLIGAGADLDMIDFVDFIHEEDADGTSSRERILFPRDIGVLRSLISHLKPLIFIIDPVSSVIRGNLDKEADVREGMDPLHEVADEFDMSIVVIRHFNKGGMTARDALSGSHAWRDVVRSYLPVIQDPETGKRILSVEKSNYAKEVGTSYEFDIESVPVEASDGHTFEVGAVRNFQRSDLSVDQVMGRGAETEESAEERSSIQQFLREVLEDNGGELPARDAIKAGYAAGFSEVDIKNARKRSKDPRILSRKASFGSGWVWKIEVQEIEHDLEGVKSSQGVQGVSLSNTTPSTPSHRLTPSQPPTNWDPSTMFLVPDNGSQTEIEVPA